MHWQFTQNNLLSRADRDLAQRTRWAPLLYLLVFTIILAFTSYISEHFFEVILLGFVIVVSALTRTLLVVQFDKWYPANPGKWRLVFMLASLSLAASWGLLCMFAVSHYQLEWTAMLVLLVTAGIAAVAVVTISIYANLVTGFLLLLLCPSIVMTAFLSTQHSIAIMLMFSLYCGFLVIVARRLSGEYWRALKNASLLDQRAKQLEDSNKELESYSYSIAHDLRGPLRTITAFSQILLEDANKKLDNQEKDSLNRIVNAGKFMAELIDDILELSRITRINIEYKDVDLTALAEECLQGLQSSEPDRKVDIEVQQNMQAKGDSQLLRIVLQNLLSNSWKFTKECTSPKIQVGTTKNAEKQAYFVKDNGVGFDVKYADKIFGIFQRLHTREEFDGTGIGLASVQRVVNRHGGKVWVNAKDQKGATFYFSLPEDFQTMHQDSL
ncbi:MAG: ATP-binding protein [Gammaproteobacteria bacterium]|jgi:signal transduction histidine kinase